MMNCRRNTVVISSGDAGAVSRDRQFHITKHVLGLALYASLPHNLRYFLLDQKVSKKSRPNDRSTHMLRLPRVWSGSRSFFSFNNLLRNIKHSLLLLLFLFSVASNAQTPFAAKAFVYQQKIYVRLYPTNSNNWSTIKQKGFTIQNNTTKSKTELKPYTANDKRWTELKTKHEQTAFVYTDLFRTAPTDIATQKRNFALAIAANTLYPALAQAQGLLWIDSLGNETQKEYFISIINDNSAYYQLMVDQEKNNYNPVLPILKATLNKNNTTLTWNVDSAKQSFAGYYIEKSLDGNSFERINKTPFLPLKTSIKNGNIEYIAPKLKQGQTMYYKLVGIPYIPIDYVYGKAIKITNNKEFSKEINIDSTVVNVIKHECKITWHIKEYVKTDTAKAVYVLTAKKYTGTFEKVTQQGLSLSTTAYIIPSIYSSTYCKIAVIDLNGDTTFSKTVTISIIDTIKPKIQENLQGKIDTNGIVILTWTPSNDEDLIGFRVFKANGLYDEFTEVTTKILDKPTFTEKIITKTLNDAVYYKVCGVDKVFNASDYSKTLKLKRPDKIAPTPAIINNIVIKNNVIEFGIIPSHSTDVKEYTIYKKTSTTNTPTLLYCFAAEELPSALKDTGVQNGIIYTYTISTNDSSNNKSIYTTLPIQFNNSTCKVQLNAEVSTKQKHIRLTWTIADTKNVYRIIILKSKDNEMLRSAEVLNEYVDSYKDNDLSINNKYNYQIKVMYKDGSTCLSNKVIQVNY